MFLTITLILTCLLALSVYWVWRKYKQGDRSRRPLFTQIGVFFALLFFAILFLGGTALAASTSSEAMTAGISIGQGLAYIGAALAVGLSGIGGGIAVAASASAAIGAISENERAFGKAMVFVAMAEGVALYGLIVAFLIILL